MKIELLYLISMTAIFAVCCAKVPESIGIRNGKLSECPDKPNCVSSMTEDKEHFIEPYKYSSESKNVKRALLATIESIDRSNIITDSDNYIHAEFKSKLFRFIDDVEFLIDDKAKVIQIRSASRTGYSDMGVNRKRMESIRKILNEKLK